MFKKGDIVKIKGNQLNNDLFEVIMLEDNDFAYIKLLEKDSRLSNNLLVTTPSIELCENYYRFKKLKKLIYKLKK